MKAGKRICKELKAVRKKIADTNGIEYHPTKCNHKGDCAGTCPKCDEELRYIERELNRLQAIGKAAVVTGVSLGISALTSCNLLRPQPSGYMERLEGEVPVKVVPDSLQEIELEGDVPVNVIDNNTDTSSIDKPFVEKR